jgi:outer membrane protein OmpA-like peptidoglycan-associated protein
MFGLFLIPVAIISLALLFEPEPPPPDPVAEKIILLPSEDGSVGAVTVTSAAGTRTLDAAPPPEVTFVLYFESGSIDTLTPASQAKVEELRAVLLQRPAPEIAVVGHTDTVGDQQDNDQLSLERARTVQQRIEEVGISAVSIQASGRGERELLVPTADRVDEPRNRRVEITIR